VCPIINSDALALCCSLLPASLLDGLSCSLLQGLAAGLASYRVIRKTFLMKKRLIAGRPDEGLEAVGAG